MFRVVLLCVIALISYYVWISIPVIHGYGETVPEAPHRHRVTIEEPLIYKNYTLKPKKVIEGNIRVLSRKRYFFDQKSDIASHDIVAGWQRMSDELVLEELYFSQKKRTAVVQFVNPTLNKQHIQAQSALFHLIPANDLISRKILQIRKGHILQIEGWVVDVESSAGFVWNFDSSSGKEFQLERSALYVMELEIK